MHNEDKNQTPSNNVSEMNLDEWKNTMLQIMTGYKERTGKDMPTYNEMLRLNQSEFDTYLWMKSRPEFLKVTLQEMAEHEKKTQSATNRFNKSIVEQRIVLSNSENMEDWSATDWSKSLLGLFDTVKSEEVMNALLKMDETAKELDPEKFKGQATPIEAAIADKAGYDYAELKKYDE